MRIASIAGLAFIGVLTLAAGCWVVLALYFSGAAQPVVHSIAAAAAGVATLATISTLPYEQWRWRAVGAFALLFAMALSWWSTIKPSNYRNWQADVAALSYGVAEGDSITIRNIRNFQYKSETDFKSGYYDKRFNLQDMEGVDIVAVYWMGPAIAHVFVSFAFTDGSHLAISIESRKEQGEAYSTLKGFFRQYELYYVVADERDVIRLRTNYRHDPPEDVFVYRLSGDIERGRKFFREYVSQMNALREVPQFYNTLTTNCTINLWANSLTIEDHLPMSWKILASGYVPELLYENGRLQSHGLSFSELRQMAHVNERANRANDAIDFSRRIRAPIQVMNRPATGDDTR